LEYYGSIIQKGDFTNDNKTGNWYYYQNMDKIEFIFNFDSLKIISDSIGKERIPIYSEGIIYFNYLIGKYLNYPIEDADDGKSGYVQISFSINADGTLGDFEVYSGCGDISLNNEALRVVKKAAEEHQWFPMINAKGEKVNSKAIGTVNFQLL